MCATSSEMAASSRGLQFLGRGVPEVARTQLLRNKGWVGGEWVDAIAGGTYPVFNPANRELIAEVPDMGSQDAQVAIDKAYGSQKAWAAHTCKERAGVLRKWFNLMMENQQDLAKIISLEMGKPLTESLTEVQYGAAYVEWFSEEAKRIYGDIIPPPSRNKRILVAKQPVGVSALITPWNFPVAMITRKAGAALSAGCTAIVKPSEETPFSALALAELAHQAGVPPGVFNVVTSSRDSTPAVGEALTSSELVAKLSFTGSTAVGKLLMSQCASTVKRVSLELGGNAPLIVFNSADVKTAIQGTLAAKFRNTGQACNAANRLLVQSGIHNQFVEELSRAVSQLRLGDPLQEDTKQGPLVNESAIEKIERHVSDAVSKGSEVVVGGSRDGSLGELFYQPSVLTKVSTDMALTREEIFGPVAPIIRFEDEEEALAVANATPFGLAGYFFSQDMNQMWRVSEQLECGMIGVNEGATSNEMIPFGGIKQSGIGREGSKYGIQEYLNIKYICIGNVDA